jgi:hypothetical protein
MKKATMKKRNNSPSRLIDARIKELGDWRGETLARLRSLIKQADHEVVEDWKWGKPTNQGTLGPAPGEDRRAPDSARRGRSSFGAVCNTASPWTGKLPRAPRCDEPYRS